MLEPGFVTNMIRRLNRNLFLLCLFGLLIALGLGVVLNVDFYNIAQGPFALSSTELLTTPDLHESRERYVTMVGDEMLDTGYEYYESDPDGSNKETLAYYGALVVGDRLLLVEVRDPIGETPGLEYTGKLIATPGDVQRDVIDALEQEYELGGAFLPYMLKTTHSWDGIYIALGLALVLLILSISGLIVILLFTINPARHYSLRNLKRYGDPVLIANEINGEFEMPTAVTVQGVHFPRNWMVHSSRFRFQIMRISDITWAYRREVQHSTHGTRLGKTYSAIIWDRNKTRIQISGKQNKVDTILKTVVQRAPWTLVGYITSDREYKKHLDRFVAQVDARKAELKGKR